METGKKNVWSSPGGRSKNLKCDAQQFKDRERWNRISKRIDYYKKKMFSSAFPTDEELTEQWQNGLLIANANTANEWTIENGKKIDLKDYLNQSSSSSVDLKKNEDGSKDGDGDTDDDKGKNDKNQTPKTKSAEKGIGKEKHISLASDLYMTMAQDIEVLLYYLPMMKRLYEFDMIVDPMCGKNNIVDFFNSNNLYDSIGSDLYHTEEKVDFLADSYSPKIEDKKYIIVSNPPFLQKTSYIDKCLKMNVPFILLLPTAYMGTVHYMTKTISNCHHILLIHPVPKFYVLGKEKPYHVKATTCAWFFFNCDLCLDSLFPHFLTTIEKSTGKLHHNCVKPDNDTIGDHHREVLNLHKEDINNDCEIEQEIIVSDCISI